MKLRYDKREDRLILAASTIAGGEHRLLLTRRLWLRLVRAMTEEVTQGTSSSAPAKRPAGKQPETGGEGPATLIDDVRLRRAAQDKYRIGFVYGKEAVNLLLSGAELTRLLGVLIGLGKSAGWDLDGALSRLESGRRSGQLPPPPTGKARKLDS